MLSCMTVLSTIQNDLFHEFINKAICNRFDRGLLQLVGNNIVNTLFKY